MSTKETKLSNCCSAPIHSEGSSEGTNWYVCEECNEACDSKSLVNQDKTQETIVNQPQKDCQPDCKPILSGCCGKEKYINPENGWWECSSCGDTFIPKEKECNACDGKCKICSKCHEMDCDCSLPKEDWRTEFDKKFCGIMAGILFLDDDLANPENIKSFIQSQIEAAHKAGWEEAKEWNYNHLTSKGYIEQGRVEERERIVRMIEEEYPLADNKTRRLLKELLANLTSNEKDIKK